MSIIHVSNPVFSPFFLHTKLYNTQLGLAILDSYIILSIFIGAFAGFCVFEWEGVECVVEGRKEEKKDVEDGDA